MQQSFSKPSQSNLEKPLPAFRVHYLLQTAMPGWLTNAQHLLGVVGYGETQPDFLPPGCPFLNAPLLPVSGEAMVEIWTASSPVRACQAGRVKGAYNDAIAFGAVTLAPDGDGMEAAVERAYLDIFDFLERSGHKAPIRFWNYLAEITGDENGMERYRRFNIGRHRAFSARLAQNLPPAASGVGGHGDSVIYFLAAPEPATPVENPRQVSAYEYPSVYGPRSPNFSRASVYVNNDASCLFVSGTASIVGHETRHTGNLTRQIVETAENLRAVIEAAATLASGSRQGDWALKIYLRDPADRQLIEPVARAIFGDTAQLLYLRGEICRKDLLVEIEAFQQF